VTNGYHTFNIASHCTILFVDLCYDFLSAVIYVLWRSSESNEISI